MDTQLQESDWMTIQAVEQVMDQAINRVTLQLNELSDIWTEEMGVTVLVRTNMVYA